MFKSTTVPHIEFLCVKYGCYCLFFWLYNLWFDIPFSLLFYYTTFFLFWILTIKFMVWLDFNVSYTKIYFAYLLFIVILYFNSCIKKNFLKKKKHSFASCFVLNFITWVDYRFLFSLLKWTNALRINSTLPLLTFACFHSYDLQAVTETAILLHEFATFHETRFFHDLSLKQRIPFKVKPQISEWYGNVRMCRNCLMDVKGVLLMNGP